MFSLRKATWRVAGLFEKQEVPVETILTDIKKYYNIKPKNLHAFYKYYGKDIEEIWEQIKQNYQNDVSDEDKVAYCIKHLLTSGGDK